MKTLISLALLFSFNSSFANSTTYQKANLISKYEINTLRNSVERVLPSFKEFKKTIMGDSSFSLYLSNSCYKEIVAYVRYLDLDNKWVDAGFWKLGPKINTYVGETRNTYYYPGAYSTDETLGWGDIPVVFQGYNLFVSELKIDASDWGDWVHEFTCDKSVKF